MNACGDSRLRGLRSRKPIGFRQWVVHNFSLPLVGRYMDDEKLGGAWYLGDCFDEDTCLANDLFVNAWMPLPKPYREDEEDGK